MKRDKMKGHKMIGDEIPKSGKLNDGDKMRETSKMIQVGDKGRQDYGRQDAGMMEDEMKG